jgi:tetratricopeptide (TPR) repeat protein
MGEDGGMRWRIPALSAILAVVALTVTGVGAGLVIHGSAGALIGAVPGALAAVAAGFVPVFNEVGKQRQLASVKLDQEKAAARANWEAIGEPRVQSIDSGPAALLDPDRGVVEFTGRDRELEALRAWCASELARSVRVLTGVGGVGKTRLALKVAAEWAARGDEWRLLDAGAEGNAVTAAREVTTGPVLLVLDYAETRNELEKLLRDVLADPGPVRVLLVARSLGEWWERLNEKSPPAVARLLKEAAPTELETPLSDDASDAELVAAAIPYFARAVGKEIPDQAEFELPPQRVPVLVLHATALLAVLQSAAEPPERLRMVVTDRVLDELLEHEARYWRRTAYATGLPEDGAVVKPVVAVAALLGAANLAETTELVGRVPELAASSLVERRRWARWLYGLYPGDDRLGTLRPDLLAETYVIGQLAKDPDLAKACMWNLSGEQALNALTVLARAWVHHKDARAVIADALYDDLTHLALPAAIVALQTRSELGSLLSAALRDADAPLDTLAAIALALPYPSVVLAEAHLAVTLRVRDLLPRETEPEFAVPWDDMAGSLLSQLGRSAEALPITQQAVDTYRALAVHDLDRYRPDLARLLLNLSSRFSEMGHPANGLPFLEEAVAAYRELVTINPERYVADLALSLTNLGVILSELGRATDATLAAQEAVTLYRELATDRHLPDLARSLGNLGADLLKAGRVTEALSALMEAAAAYRKLAASSLDQYGPDLARSLVNLGIYFSMRLNSAKAISAAEEAVTIYRELADTNPGRYRPDLAQSLVNLGAVLTAQGQPAEALPVIEEAITAYQKLALVSPDRYRPDLARALNNLGACFLMMRRLTDALLPTEEAIAIRRELAARSPERFIPDLAHSLENLAALLDTLGREGEALKIESEVNILRRES